MATKIVTKNSSTAGAAPTATDLVQGELAVNVADGRLYTEDNAAAIVELGVNPATEITANAGIALPDSQKATFGAGDDLQIYHDGSNSYIADEGSGFLVLKTGATGLLVQNGSGQNVIQTGGNDVTLRYGSVTKLATTSTGIDVTGRAVVDGLTSSASIVGTSNSNSLGGTTFTSSISTVGLSSSAAITSTSNSNSLGGTSFTSNIDVTGTASATSVTSAGHLTAGSAFSLLFGDGGERISGNNSSSLLNFFTAGAERMRIDSAGNVGIGTSSPSSYVSSGSNLVIAGSAGSGMTIASGTGSAGNLFFADGTVTDSAYRGYVQYNHSTDSLQLGTAATERMRIDSAGNIKQNSVNTSTNVGYSVNNGTYDAIALGTGGFGVNGGAATDGGIRAYNNLLFGTGSSATERMRIDSAGRVGIGTSSPSSILSTSGTDTTAYSSSSVGGQDSLATLKIQNLTTSANSFASIDFNTNNNRVVNRIVSSHGSTTTDGFLAFVTEGSGTPAERMRIDSAGRVGIGTSSPVSLIHLKAGVDSTNGGIRLESADGTNFSTIDANNAGNLRFYQNGNASMRLDASGNLLVGKSDSTFNNTAGISQFPSGRIYITRDGGNCLYLNRVNTTGSVAAFYNGNTSSAVGTISVTGSATSYNTSSDQRLKENITDADDAGSKIDSIQVRKYDWKADGSHQDYGMIAQELQLVAPEAVSGDADSEDMMGVDYSKLVPMLIKEIQSLRNRVAQLETGE